jgi:hypothetical protein
MMTMAKAVYLLCILTSFACAGLLIRSYLRTRAGLLLWCAFCFIGLLINNLLMFIDLVVVPEIDLSILRTLTALIALAMLLYGLIWETKE